MIEITKQIIFCSELPWFLKENTEKMIYEYKRGKNDNNFVKNENLLKKRAADNSQTYTRDSLKKFMKATKKKMISMVTYIYIYMYDTKFVTSSSQSHFEEHKIFRSVVPFRKCSSKIHLFFLNLIEKNSFNSYTYK